MKGWSRDRLVLAAVPQAAESGYVQGVLHPDSFAVTKGAGGWTKGLGICVLFVVTSV